MKQKCWCPSDFVCYLFTTNLIFNNLHENSEIGEMIAGTDDLVIIWFLRWTSFSWPVAVNCRPKTYDESKDRILETVIFRHHIAFFVNYGNFHEKTCTGTSFKPVWLLESVSRLHGECLTSYRIWKKGRLMFVKCKAKDNCGSLGMRYSFQSPERPILSRNERRCFVYMTDKFARLLTKNSTSGEKTRVNWFQYDIFSGIIQAI